MKRPGIPLLIGTLLFAVAAASLALPARAQLPERGDERVCLELEYDETGLAGVFKVIPCPDVPTPTATPFPTWTLTPTRTPIVAATFTPTPTHTPSNTPAAPPTHTPEPTATVEDFRTPSPTPPPPATSTPTLTATPFVGKCWGAVTAGSLNARAEPWGAIVGQVHYGELLAFDAKWDQDFWWWRIEAYESVGDNEYIGAWVSSNWIEVGDTADCSGLEDKTPSAARAITQGAHIIGANGANELIANHCQDLTTVKLFQDMIAYADDFRACNPDIWIVCRYWTDGIALENDYQLDRVWDTVKYWNIPPECNALELENERTPQTQEQWERLSPFSIGVARLIQDTFNLQYCAFSWGPGWPAFDKLQYVVDYIRWVQDNPLPDGRYHCIAAHAAMIFPTDQPQWPWVNNDYITPMRWTLFRDWIYAITPDDFDLYEWPGVIAITEIGLSNGYAGSNAPYTCVDLKTGHWTTYESMIEIFIAYAQQDWNYGAGGRWTDDTRCAATVWG